MEKTLRISFFNDLTWLPVVLNTTKKIGSLSAISDNDCQRMATAVTCMVEGIIVSNPSGSEFLINISYEQLTYGLKIEINDMGIPWDLRNIPNYKPGQKEFNDSIISLFLAEKIFDEISGTSLGRQGHLVTLTKYSGSKPSDEQSQVSVPILKTADNQIELRYQRLEKLSEAIGVAKCLYQAYGYTYGNEKLYYPDVVYQKNVSGQIISMLAKVADNDEIVGHSALLREDIDNNIAEIGTSAVFPEFRGRGILNKISDYLLAIAEQEKLAAIFARCVTTHVYSQKVRHKLGFVDCALLLAVGNNVQFKAIDQTGTERESFIMTFKYLHNQLPMKLYMPVQHLDMICKILTNLGLSVVPCQINSNTDQAASEDIKITIHGNDYGSAFIIIDGCIKSVKKQVLQTIKKLCKEKREAIYIYIPLHLPQYDDCLEDLQKAGCFFAGIFPGSEGKCWLILQYMNNLIIDYQKLQLNSQFGRELAEYVKNCDPNNDDYAN